MQNRRLTALGVVFLLGLLVCPLTNLWSLELEPGIYRSAPVGLNALTVAYAYASGNILTDDAAVPIENAQARSNFALVGYGRFMNLFGMTARADALAPIGWGHYEGDLNGQTLTRDVHGLGDPKFRFTTYLFGAPALDRAQFQNYHQQTIVALSLMLSAPFGQYDSGRLVNLGSNRWGFRPEAGFSSVRGKWTLETAVGAWVYTPNHDYYHGNELTEAPIGYVKGDFIYSFARPLWLSFNYGYGVGGRSTVNQVEQADLEHNTQLGGTLSLAVSPSNVVKFNYTKSFVSSVGPEFETYVVAVSHQWGGK